MPGQAHGLLHDACLGWVHALLEEESTERQWKNAQGRKDKGGKEQERKEQGRKAHRSTGGKHNENAGGSRGGKQEQGIWFSRNTSRAGKASQADNSSGSMAKSVRHPPAPGLPGRWLHSGCCCLSLHRWQGLPQQWRRLRMEALPAAGAAWPGQRRRASLLLGRAAAAGRVEGWLGRAQASTCISKQRQGCGCESELGRWAGRRAGRQPAAAPNAAIFYRLAYPPRAAHVCAGAGAQKAEFIQHLRQASKQAGTGVMKQAASL
jgi:hypothetical protein